MLIASNTRPIKEKILAPSDGAFISLLPGMFMDLLLRLKIRIKNVGWRLSHASTPLFKVINYF
jgi:hypothetical protein